MTFKSIAFLSTTALFVTTSSLLAEETVPDSVIDAQRAALAENTDGKGFGPQAPRNIDASVG